jgi:hypothetical protein
MKLEKLFGSKTKVDIIKYLLFKRQGVSMRALETELTWTFPAIKKQIDALNDAEVIDVDKDHTKRSITIKKDFYEQIKIVFMYCMRSDIKQLFARHESMIDSYYEGKIFGYALDMDLVVIYKNADKEQLALIKEEISEIFRHYFIEMVNVVFMSHDERQKRYRLADKFVLTVLRSIGK